MERLIVETALKEFLKSGIREMSVAKLVRTLGISTKTFYKHYESKEALLKECLDLLYGGYYAEFQKITGSSQGPVNKLLAVFKQALDQDFGINHAFFHDLNYYYPELQNEAIKRIREEASGIFVPLFEQGITDGYFLPQLNPQVALTGINLLYTSITRGQHYPGMQDNPQLLFENLVVTFIRGMCTEKGRTQLKND